MSKRERIELFEYHYTGFLLLRGCDDLVFITSRRLLWENNEHVPHSAFEGQTPDEMYFATGADVPEKLKAVPLLARQARREANLALSCSACRTEPKLIALESPPTVAAIPSNTS